MDKSYKLLDCCGNCDYSHCPTEYGKNRRDETMYAAHYYCTLNASEPPPFSMMGIHIGTKENKEQWNEWRAWSKDKGVNESGKCDYWKPEDLERIELERIDIHNKCKEMIENTPWCKFS